VSASSVVLLPHAPSSVGVARHRLGADLRAHGVSENAVAEASLVLSELMSNAIRHGGPLPGAQVRVAWTLASGSLEIAVTDGGGPAKPRPVHRSPSAPGGRGLNIVERMSRDWGVRHDEQGTTVWAVLPAGSGGSKQRQPYRTPAGGAIAPGRGWLTLGLPARPPAGAECQPDGQERDRDEDRDPEEGYKLGYRPQHDHDREERADEKQDQSPHATQSKAIS
jgi:anti-sigma regulatory factor (Ser/Thr protein kinase)